MILAEIGSTAKSRMRVLFWLRKFWPQTGGIQILAARLLPALQERGYEFTVVTSSSDSAQPGESEYSGIPVHDFPFGDTRSYSNIDRLMEIRWQVSKLKRTFAPNVVHIFSTGRGDFFHLTTSNSYPAPLLVTLHGERLHLGDSFRAQTLRAADWVTCISAAVLTSVRQLGQEIVPRSSLVYNGVDMPPDSPEPLPTDGARLLCLGRLVPEKGFDVALAAFASIIARFPEVRLTVAGDGPQRSRLEQQAIRLGVQDAVDFAGWIDPENVPALINTATAVVMPSRYEPFGLVALDAALMARPIIASRVGGLAEVIEHEHTGLLVEKEDSKALADAMAFLLDHPERATQMGQAARQRTQAVFSWQRYVDAYDNLYQRLITKAD